MTVNIVPILVFLVILPSGLSAQEHKAALPLPVAEQGNYVLTVVNDRVSLKAQEASLQAILGELGHKMGVEVVGKVSPQERITAEFYNLPLEQALHLLGSNYGYQMNTDRGQPKIAKIFVPPQGRKTGDTPPNVPVPQSAATAPTSISQEFEEPSEPEVSERPKPFKFEFDPAAVMAK